MGVKEKVIDPRTTRRTVDIQKYRKNSALYSTYEVVSYVGNLTSPHAVVLQKRPEHCRRVK